MTGAVEGEKVEGKESKRGRHTECNFMEINHHFCLTLLLFCFSKNVSPLCQSFFYHLL